MNTPDNTNASDTGAVPHAKRRRAIAMAAAMAVAIGAACAAYANGLPSLHGHGDRTPMSPAMLKAHIGKMIEQCAPDASADQKARLEAIADGAVDDLRAVHTQFREEHARGPALLMAPVVDRVALEQWRAGQIHQVDLMSRRLLAAAEDAAEQLTPEQRTRCGGHVGMPMH